MIDYIKFFCIFIFFIISLLCGKNCIQKKDSFLLNLAMLCTLIADYFLIINGNHLLGVLFFIIVQLVYSYRYCNTKYLKITIPLCSTIFILFNLILLIKRNNFSINEYYEKNLVIIALIYAILSVFNIIGVSKAYINKKYSFPNNILNLLGIIFLALCDICIAVINIPVFTNNFYELNVNLKSILTFLIWFFYFPSQFSLCISAKRFN